MLTDQTSVKDVPVNEDSSICPGVEEIDSNEGNGATEPTGTEQSETASDSYKMTGQGSPKSPRSLKNRQQSRKAKYDRKCASCKKPFKAKAQPLSTKMVLKLRETFEKYSRATWRGVERQLLTHNYDGTKMDDAVIDNHSHARPDDTKTLNTRPQKTPAEMRSGLQEHFSELLFPGALYRGESAHVPWASLGEWLENNQKRLVNWPTGVKFPDSSYQMVGFWNLTEVNALYGVKIVNWSSNEKQFSMPTTPLVFNQMGHSVVNISQIEELRSYYGTGGSSVDSSTGLLSDSEIEVQRRVRNDGFRHRLSIRAVDSI